MPSVSNSTAIRARKAVLGDGNRGRIYSATGSGEEDFQGLCSFKTIDVMDDAREYCLEISCHTLKSFLGICRRYRWPTLHGCSKQMSDPCTSESRKDSESEQTRNSDSHFDTTTKPSQPIRRPASPTRKTQVYLVPLTQPESFESIGIGSDRSVESRNDEEVSHHPLKSGVDCASEGSSEDLSSSCHNGTVDLVLDNAERTAEVDRLVACGDENAGLFLTKGSWDGELNMSVGSPDETLRVCEGTKHREIPLPPVREANYSRNMEAELYVNMKPDQE